MTSMHQPRIQCRVVGGEKLPASVGGAAALCAAIERAAAASPTLHFSVVVKVLGQSRLSASLTTADGKILPEQKYAISDRSLDKPAIDRFASSLIQAALAGR